MTTTPPPYDPAALPEWKPRSKRLGQLALVGAIAVFVLSLIASVLIGAATAPLSDTSAGGFQFNLEASSPDPVERALAIASLLHVGLGTVLGIAAMVAGILAIATRRGRGYGVAALIVAFLAPGISLIVFTTSLALSLSPEQLG